eukprot:TRINITY_DN962_c0_g1_i1.p1 TRINITY_DN962_c0_g1~~TRINITY_DN962_c0_g1_i1.p1  ORF type:complete len:516 (-),score=120.40 TRINITY_DN962_c0_g1_i1:218-1765(-)
MEVDQQQPAPAEQSNAQSENTQTPTAQPESVATPQQTPAPTPASENTCDQCNKHFEKLLRCGKCKVVRYCSADCQKKAWPQHKLVCGKKVEPPQARPVPSKEIEEDEEEENVKYTEDGKKIIEIAAAPPQKPDSHYHFDPAGDSVVYDLMQDDSVWLVLLRRTLGFVDKDGVPHRPFIVMLFEIAPRNGLRTREIVLDHRIGRLPHPGYVYKILIKQMKLSNDLMQQPPHRPKSIIFTSKYLFGHLKQVLENLRIIPKFWTEEENQGYGDQYVELFSKHMRKKGFTESNNSHKPGLLQIAGVGRRLVAGMYSAAAEYYKNKNWQHFQVRDILQVTWLDETWYFVTTRKEDFTQVLGIIQEENWEELVAILKTGVRKTLAEDVPGAYHKMTIYTEELAIPFQDLADIDKWSFEIADLKPGSTCWPFPGCFRTLDNSNLFRPTRAELWWLEVGLRTLNHIVKEFAQQPKAVPNPEQGEQAEQAETSWKQKFIDNELPITLENTSENRIHVKVKLIHV